MISLFVSNTDKRVASNNGSKITLSLNPAVVLDPNKKWPNTCKGYEYASLPTIYKFTYYSPSSNNPCYGDTNYTANSWKMETVSYIPLSSSSTLHNMLDSIHLKLCVIVSSTTVTSIHRHFCVLYIHNITI